MKNLRFVLYGAVLCLALLTALAGNASADVCTGSCGTSGTDGVVTLSPTGNPTYQWVSTNGGVMGVGTIPVGAPAGNETNGSTLATTMFTVNANSTLNFFFNYVTSDGTGFADYAWAELFDSSNNPVALLFTAQTETSGSIVPAPGLQLPAAGATLTPSSAPIIPGLSTWSPLGTSSGTCFISPSSGCGFTGWIQSNYVITNAGTYYLEVGVVNAIDTAFQSGMAFDGVTINGVPINPVGTPEPGSMALLGVGILGVAAVKLLKK
jgi:hypothetical protein